MLCIYHFSNFQIKLNSMKVRFSFIYIFLFTTLIFSSCGSDDAEPELNLNGRGDLVFYFDNTVGNELLALNNTTYKNSSGESFRVTGLSYYVSNFKLQRKDGGEYVIPQDSSYFLINAADKNSYEVRLENVPVGDYSGVSFVLGVDSARTVSSLEKRKGVLDIAAGQPGASMYSDANDGYTFLKLEGTSVSAASGKFEYQIKGFGGATARTVNNIKTINIPFTGTIASVTTTKSPEAHLLINILKIFDGSTRISIAGLPQAITPELTAPLASNYTTMFTLDHIHPTSSAH